MKNKTFTGMVSIVGRPNVGKSSLFNRLVGARQAVVLKEEGTTRDRSERYIDVKGKKIILVDTGGFVPDEKDELYKLVKQQIETAVLNSEVLLFVCDGADGLLPIDMSLAQILRRSGKKIILVVNKIDNDKRRDILADFYELGLGEPYAVSCQHKIGVDELLDEINAKAGSLSPGAAKVTIPIKVACVGRPNVGKSSFINKLIDEERLIVHEVPHTTRDSVDVCFEKDGLSLLLIDTAGIRHGRKIKFAVETYSIMRSQESVRRSDIAILVVDGMEGITSDDARIFDFIMLDGRACVIVVNKWDLVKAIETSRYEKAIHKKIPYARHFPIIFASAKTGRNVKEAFRLITAIKTNSEISIDGETLNEFLKEIGPEKIPCRRQKRTPIFYSMQQENVFPKEFVLYVNDPGSVMEEHRSYIENRLRESFPLKGIPVKLFFKRKKKRKRKGEC